MMTPTQPQTFAAWIATCKECGAELNSLQFDFMTTGKRQPFIRPCGHTGPILVIPNPKLPHAS